MTGSTRYEIEFYHVEQATEFRVRFDDRRAYDDAKAFLDRLLGPRGVLSGQRSRQPRQGGDFYGVDETQYRAFQDFMRRSKS